MKKSVESKQQESKVPFFARYLEDQELEQATGGARNPPFVTLKYPSDDDEYPMETL